MPQQYVQSDHFIRSYHVIDVRIEAGPNLRWPFRTDARSPSFALADGAGCCGPSFTAKRIISCHFVQSTPPDCDAGKLRLRITSVVSPEVGALYHTCQPKVIHMRISTNSVQSNKQKKSHDNMSSPTISFALIMSLASRCTA